MATFTATAQSTPGRVTFYFTSLQYPANEYSFDVDIYWNNIYQRSESWVGTGTGSASYQSFDYGYGITLRCEGYAIRKGVSYFVGSSTVTTNGNPTPIPSTPSYLNVFNVSITGFDISWGSSTDAEEYYVYFNGSFLRTVRHPTTSSRVTTTLTPNVSYSICVSASNITGESSKRCSTVLVAPNRPADWTWNFTSPNLFTLTNKVATIVDAAQWNNFTSRINEFRVYKLGAGNNYNFTSANTTMTNSHVTNCINQAALAINDMVSNKLPTNYSGVTITKDVFNTMATRLNSIT